MAVGQTIAQGKITSVLEYLANFYAGIVASIGLYTTINTTISSGASLSSEIDISGFRNIAIEIPSAWTTANLTFQGSSATGGTFVDIYDAAGNELTVSAAASRLLTDIPELAPIRFLKIRSGTTGSSVNQGADRTITLFLKG